MLKNEPDPRCFGHSPVVIYKNRITTADSDRADSAIPEGFVGKPGLSGKALFLPLSDIQTDGADKVSRNVCINVAHIEYDQVAATVSSIESIR